MKQPYEKPAMIVESFTTETWLCACAVDNPLPSQLEQCGYYDDTLGFTLFNSGWTACDDGGSSGGSNYYCYHVSANNLFTS